MTSSAQAIEPPEACPECGEPLVRSGQATVTMVDYRSPTGHDHDDNCVVRTFYCAADHETKGSVQRRCPTPGCGWAGKPWCSCHGCGEQKRTRWPTMPRPRTGETE